MTLRQIIGELEFPMHLKAPPGRYKSHVQTTFGFKRVKEDALGPQNTQASAAKVLRIPSGVVNPTMPWNCMVAREFEDPNFFTGR